MASTTWWQVVELGLASKLTDTACFGPTIMWLSPNQAQEQADPVDTQ